MQPAPAPVLVLPSILAADMAHLARDCARALDAGAAGLHVDVMDGHFVPNLSMGPAVVKDLRRAFPSAYLHVHLMVTAPDRYALRFLEAGADTVLVHAESPCDLPATLRAIRAAGARAGITLNPETPASALDPFRGLVDEILVMTVHPGFGGQAFMADQLPKFPLLRAAFPGVPLSVDGGVDLSNAPQCAAAGASILAAGSSLFRAPDMAAAIAAMRASALAAFPR